MSDFNELLFDAKKDLKTDEVLVVKEPNKDDVTGEVLFDGAVYKTVNKMPGCSYRTQDNPINANVDTEVQKGVSVADFSDYVDNRDVIRGLMAHSERTGMSLRRYVSDLGVDDNINDSDIDEDYDLDEIDDLELMTMQNEVGEAIKQALNNQQNSKPKSSTDDEEELSSNEEKGEDQGAE